MNHEAVLPFLGVCVDAVLCFYLRHALLVPSPFVRVDGNCRWLLKCSDKLSRRRGGSERGTTEEELVAGGLFWPLPCDPPRQLLVRWLWRWRPVGGFTVVKWTAPVTVEKAKSVSTRCLNGKLVFQTLQKSHSSPHPFTEQQVKS